MSEILSDFFEERDTERLLERKLLSFELQGKQFDVVIQLLPNLSIDLEHANARDFEIKVILKNGNVEEGILGGIIKPSSNKSSYEIKNMYSINNGVDITNSNPVKKVGYTPGLIAETIRQLILQDVVTRWFSATALTKGGKSIYEKLSTDPNLVVEEDKQLGSFTVTKKFP